MVKAKRLGLAGLVLGGVTSLVTPALAFANEQVEQAAQVEQENREPVLLATFEYESHRPEPEYNGKIFTYHLWSDGKISQADSDLHPDSIVEPEIKFASRWFWDIDGDEQYGDAEINAIKSGKLIYMHPEFNKIANEEIKRAFSRIEQKIEPQKIEVPEEERREELRRPKKAKNLWSPIFGIDYSPDFVAGSLGVRYEPIDDIGFALVARQGFGPDKVISEITTPASPQGIYGHGKIEDSNRKFSGIGGEFQLGPIIFGGGINNYTSTRKTTEDLLRNGEVIKPNSYSTANSEFTGYISAGLEFKLGNRQNFGLGANAYLPVNSKQKPSAGIRVSYRLNNRKK